MKKFAIVAGFGLVAFAAGFAIFCFCTKSPMLGVINLITALSVSIRMYSALKSSQEVE